VGNEEEAVLIDAGLSCRETEKRMKQLGLSLKKVKGIFITHEHIDHVKGVEVISQKHDIPVYINRSTRQHCRLPVPEKKSVIIQNDETIEIGELKISAFSKWHDAIDPVSYVVACKDVHVGVFTDIGSVCENLIQRFSQCQVVFLEANYDDYLLENGPYPFMLKERNNHPDVVLEKFKTISHDVRIGIASRHEATPVFHYGIDPKKTAPESPMQLNLFGDAGSM